MTMRDKISEHERRAAQLVELAAFAAVDAFLTAAVELLEHERQAQLRRTLDLGVSQSEAANTVGRWPTTIRNYLDATPDVDHAYEHATREGVGDALQRLDSLVDVVLDNAREGVRRGGQ